MQRQMNCTINGTPDELYNQWHDSPMNCPDNHRQPMAPIAPVLAPRRNSERACLSTVFHICRPSHPDNANHNHNRPKLHSHHGHGIAFITGRNIAASCTKLCFLFLLVCVDPLVPFSSASRSAFASPIRTRKFWTQRCSTTIRERATTTTCDCAC